MLTVRLQQSVDEPSNPAVHFISNTQRCRSVCCLGNCTWPAWRWHYVLAETGSTTAGHYQRTVKELRAVRVTSKNCRITIRELSGYHQRTVEELSENCESNFRELSGNYQRTVRVPSEKCQSTNKELS